MSTVVCASCNYGAAKKWCTECEEGLCEKCEKAHKTNKPSRDHQLISVTDYLKIADVPINQTCEHHEKRLDLFCKVHDVAICVDCLPSKHKNCSDVLSLQESSNNVKKSTALADLEETVDETLKNIKHFISNQEMASKEIENHAVAVKKEIEKTKLELIKHLDDLEEKCFARLEENRSSCQSKYATALKQLKSVEKILSEIKHQTIQLKQLATDIQVFLGMRQFNKTILEQTNLAKSTLDSLNNYSIKMDVHSNITSFIKDVDHFAELTIVEQPVNLVFREAKIDQAQMEISVPHTLSVNEIRLDLKQKINVKSKGNKHPVTGCIMLPENRLLVADYNGIGKLMEYNDKGQHIRDLPVSSRSYDATEIDPDRIAVSYGGSNHVEIVNIKNNKLEKKIKTENRCWGIFYQNGKLYIGVEGQGLEVKDKTGNTLNTIKCNVDCVWYLTVTNDKIYYTNNINHTVHCCSLSGKELWVFQDKSVKWPQGISVDNNNNVFVVGCYSNTLTVIQHDGKSSKTLLTASDGLDNPGVVYYRKDNNTLVVGDKPGSIAIYSVIYNDNINR